MLKVEVWKRIKKKKIKVQKVLEFFSVEKETKKVS